MGYRSEIPFKGYEWPQTQVGVNWWTSQLFAENARDYGKLKGHNGVDIAFPYRTEIYAVEDGFVNWAGFDPAGDKGYGNVIFIWTETETGYEERTYAHFDELIIKIGDRVKRGQLIGYGDSTGYSTGHHLHYGLRFRDKSKNVINYDNGYLGYVNPMSDILRLMSNAILIHRTKPDGTTEAGFYLPVTTPAAFISEGLHYGKIVPHVDPHTVIWDKVEYDAKLKF